METKDGKYGYFLRGMVLGGVLGGLAGLLFAPKSGKELRSDLKEKGSEAVSEAKRVYSETQDRAKAILEEAERQLSEASQRAKKILTRLKESKGGETAPVTNEYGEETAGEA